MKLYLLCVVFLCAFCVTKNNKKRIEKQSVNDRKSFRVWNGEDSSSNEVGALVRVEFEDNSNNLKETHNAGSAVGYKTTSITQGCYLTAGHVLANEVNFMRTHEFSTMEYGAKPLPTLVGNPQFPNETTIPNYVMNDRQKLHKEVFIPILEKAPHPKFDTVSCADSNFPNLTAAEIDNCMKHDIGVVYVPPVGFRYSHVNGSTAQWSTPRIRKEVAYSADIAAYELSTAVNTPGDKTDVVGYGLRNMSGDMDQVVIGPNEYPGSNPPPGEDPAVTQQKIFDYNLTQRVGMERKGEVRYYGLEFCDGDEKTEATCGLKLYVPWNDIDPATGEQNPLVSAMPGDSGGGLIEGSKIRAITSIISSHDHIENFFPGFLEALPENIITPLSVSPFTIGTNPRYTENFQFITNPNYDPLNQGLGQSVPMVCRPKPFLVHGPAGYNHTTGVPAGTGTNKYVINTSNTAGGYVNAKNTDALGQYADTDQNCGSPNGASILIWDECTHNTIATNVTNNSPVITTTLTAHPWVSDGYHFVKWVTNEGSDCECEGSTNTTCLVKNTDILANYPDGLIDSFKEACFALFEKVGSGSDGGGTAGGPM